MAFPKQHTIAHSVHCVGVGLHSGENVTMTLHPASTNAGVVFVRSDVENEAASIVKADYRRVTSTQLGTTLTNEHGVSVATVEHLMAALWGCSIDNVIVQLDGPEVPIMDGSSEPFIFLIDCAGVKEQSASRKVIEVLKPVEVTEDNKFARVSPSDTFSIDLAIEFNDNVIAHQEARFDISSLSFKKDISRARTFCFEKDVEKMQSLGLARGGSLENAIVVNDEGIINEDGLRYQDEFVRHKILDCIGDFYLSGVLFKAGFSGYRTGHDLNNKLLHALFEDKSAWRVIEPVGTHLTANAFAS